MAINVLQAAKYLAEKSGWKLTRLELQKMVYLAHMVYSGNNKGRPLVEGDFEAWKYGPVHKELYMFTKKNKTFNPNEDDFDAIKSLDEEKHKEEIYVLGEISKYFLPGSAAKLMRIVHWEGGAWAKHYDKNKYNTIIPQKDIKEEYVAHFG